MFSIKFSNSIGKNREKRVENPEFGVGNSKNHEKHVDNHEFGIENREFRIRNRKN